MGFRFFGKIILIFLQTDIGWKAMKKKSTGGSIMVPVKIGKNKITKIMLLYD